VCSCTRPYVTTNCQPDYQPDYQLRADTLNCKAGRPIILLFLPAFVARILTPRSRKSGYGLLLGCRSPLDAGHEKKAFFMLFLLKNRENIVWRSCPASQSIGRGGISREGALDHRKSRERRDKIFAAKTENAKKIQKQNWIRKTVFSEDFSFFWPQEN